MRKLAYAVICCAVTFGVGCSGDDAKKGDPKLAPGVKEDNRLKPAEAGGASPQGAKGQNAVKGD